MKNVVPEGPSQTMAAPRAVSAFGYNPIERSRFTVGRLAAAYGD